MKLISVSNQNAKITIPGFIYHNIIHKIPCKIDEYRFYIYPTLVIKERCLLDIMNHGINHSTITGIDINLDDNIKLRFKLSSDIIINERIDDNRTYKVLLIKYVKDDFIFDSIIYNDVSNDILLEDAF